MLEWLAENIGTILITAGLILLRRKMRRLRSLRHGRKMPRLIGLRRQRPQGC